MRAGRNRNTDGSCRFKEWKNYEKNDSKAIGLVSAILPNVKAAQESGRSCSSGVVTHWDRRHMSSGLVTHWGQETYELRIGEDDCQKEGQYGG